MIKNIVFDMGEVLIRFDRKLFIERLGIHGSDADILMREVFLSLEWSMMDRGSLTDTQAAEIICARVPERLHDAVEKLVSMWDRPIIEVPGMYDIVKELHEAGYKIYLLSNASIRQHDYWPRIPASVFFDGTMVSADEHLVKPQPEIYRAFCERFGLVPGECFFIDDSTPNVEGAVWSGLDAMVFHNDAPEVRRKLRERGVKISE